MYDGGGDSKTAFFWTFGSLGNFGENMQAVGVPGFEAVLLSILTADKANVEDDIAVVIVVDQLESSCCRG